MKKLVRIVLTLAAVAIIYYGVEQYRLKEMDKISSEMTIVYPERFDKVSIIQYPEQSSYVSFDYDEVQATMRALKKLELDEAKKLNVSENYTKIKLLEDGAFQYVEYYFYDNGSVEVVEKGALTPRSAKYKMDEEKLERTLSTLLAGKVLE